MYYGIGVLEQIRVHQPPEQERKMRATTVIRGSVLTGMLSLMSGGVIAGDASEDLIAQAMSAAPASVSANATIMNNDGTILREGSNGWTCLPHTMPGDNAPMCNDALWMKMMQALGNKAEFEADGIGISYMPDDHRAEGDAAGHDYGPLVGRALCDVG
jgi:hypothetical protein